MKSTIYDHKINILMLFMEPEFEVTVKSIEYLLHSIRKNNLSQVTISLLLNGPENPDFRSFFSDIPELQYYCANVNLGVAGGRNFLFETPECRACDLIFILDNDIVPTEDYIVDLGQFLLDRPQAGVVGASVLNYEPIEFMTFDDLPKKIGAFKNEITPLSNAQLRLFAATYPHKKYFYHIGSHPNWEASYFHSTHPEESVLCMFGELDMQRFHTDLKSEEGYRSAFRDNSVYEFEVSNVIGASQAFRRSLLDEIGPLCNLFNPYGFEDADFSIRAIKSGKKNYVSTHTFLLHGTDVRHKSRKTATQKGNSTANVYRAMTILFYRFYPETYMDLINKRMFYSFALNSIGHGAGDMAYELLYYQKKGVDLALKQISTDKGLDLNETASRTH